MTFNWTLDGRRNTTSPGAFTVTVDGTPTRPSLAPGKFTIFDENVRNIHLSVSPRIKRGQTVTVSYTKPTNNRLLDRAGNQVDSFEDFGVTNNSDLSPSSPGIGPTPVSAVVSTSGQNIFLTMDEAVDPVNTPSISTFTITIDGTEFSPISVLGGLETNGYILYLNTIINRGQTATISYTDPNLDRNNNVGVIQDTDGNDGPYFTNFPVTNGSTVTGDPCSRWPTRKRPRAATRRWAS